MVCAGDSAASDVAMVMVNFSGHVGGEELAEGHLGAMAAPRSRFGGLARGLCMVRATRYGRKVFRAKAQRSGANDDAICGCRNPLGGILVGTFSALELRVKTLDHSVSMTVSLWRRRGVSVGFDLASGSLVASLVYFVDFCLCVRGFTYHLESIVSLGFIYKADTSLRGRLHPRAAL